MLIRAATSDAQIARSWNTGNGVWSADSNWSPIGVPESNDSARIGNLAGVANDVVTLDMHDTVAEVQITDGMTLDTHTNALTVLGDTLVSGSNLVSGQRFSSRLFLERGTLIHDYETDNLTVVDGGAVQLFDGGLLRIDDLFSIDSESGLFGEGVVRFTASGTVFANDGTIQPTAGGMTLDVQQFADGGQLDLDGATGNGLLQLSIPNVDGTAFPSLTIDDEEGTLADAFDGEIRMATGSLLAMNIDDPWSVGPSGLIRIVDGIINPARITGADVSIGGRVLVSGPDGYLRIVANATLASTINVDLLDDTRMQFTGEAVVEGGTFEIEGESTIEFDGPTTIRGGTFESDVTDAFTPTVVLNGATVYQDDVTFAGHARQVGDADVTANTVINARIFDMDGTSGTVWDIDATATINADRIEVGTLPNGVFDGTIDVAGPLAARLTVNLSDPNESWTISGTLNLNGNTLFSSTRLAGSPINMRGDANISGLVIVSADTWFTGPGTVNFATAATRLQMSGNSVVDATVAFSGNGEFVNGPTSSMSLAVGLSTGQVGVRNSGRLRLGDAVGVVSVDRFENADGATLLVDVGRNTVGTDSDVLTTSSGAATLAGFLQPNIVNIGGTFETPEVGDSFTVLTAVGGVNDTFDDVLDSLLGGQVYEWNAIYNPASVIIEVASIGGLLGDYNNNGVVDAPDYSVWQDSVGSMTNLSADGNLDGVIDQGDYNTWLAHFGDTLGNGNADATVPEPASACLLLVLAGVAACAATWQEQGARKLRRACRGKYPAHAATRRSRLPRALA